MWHRADKKKPEEGVECIVEAEKYGLLYMHKLFTIWDGVYWIDIEGNCIYGVKYWRKIPKERK